LKKRMICLWFSFFFAAAAGLLAQGANTLVVGKPDTPCPNVGYTTIGAAVAAASAGDVIEVCPGAYPEQLVITMPLTLRGITVNNVSRILLDPALVSVSGQPTEAVITVVNTSGVKIQNLAIDASNNTVSGCAAGVPGLAAVHFSSSSGVLENSAIFGAQVANPQSCVSALPYGNGIAVQVDEIQTGSFTIGIDNNSIRNFTSNGILVNGAGIQAEIAGNSITGAGPNSGTFQFAVFLANGASGNINHNVIAEGLCGTLTISNCISQRSEGITLRAIGNGTIVDSNVITKAQSGIFINGANQLQVTNNQIRDIEAMSGMDVQASASGVFTNNVISGNLIFNVGPINSNASSNEEGCGINEYSGTGTFSGNQISQNTITDAYCGIAHVTSDVVTSGAYFDVLYNEFNSDLYLDGYPPAVEP
jgi:hypothetical protein